jgi:hypothetical protein
MRRGSNTMERIKQLEAEIKELKAKISELEDEEPIDLDMDIVRDELCPAEVQRWLVRNNVLPYNEADALTIGGLFDLVTA